jgi:hypothetical protein
MWSWVYPLNVATNHFDGAALANHLESFEMWCWRRMEKISLTDRVRNEEVLHTVKEGRNILKTFV